jgi:hypothetical protein
VHTNLVPVSGPWFSLASAVEYARAVTAEQTVGIHDALLSQIGQGMMKRWIDGQHDRPYRMLTPGDTIDIP